MLPDNWRGRLKRLARTTGYDIVRYRATELKQLQHHRVDVVLDVGANEGQYARHLRGIGYKGRIVSVEPLAAPFETLQRSASSDPRWDAVQMGLGAEDREVLAHVPTDTRFSSIRQPLPALHAFDDDSRPVRTERIDVRRLDGVFDQLVQPHERVFLKVDTQGYELEVLDGADGVLDRLVGLRLEMSLAPLYEGEPLANEVLQRVAALGFALWDVEAVGYNPQSWRALQIDGLFYRDQSASG